ncbi:hypothetical protein RhiirA1_472735 [Rhizophagus irregularis]|uniref:F-box domain-containing protein n=1 Tax=Rhizophagus irregularis TaxID=588596 RepID=A0A2N0R1U0_9GLOM|nr:hypothetical protein RhiirA1_472735 [Rhizophagus irregularis]
MTYSKIFSGDLPEITNEIIKYFINDYKILHSFILVNRLCCRLTTLLFWEIQFSAGNNGFINIYLHNLNEENNGLQQLEIYQFRESGEQSAIYSIHNIQNTNLSSTSHPEHVFNLIENFGQYLNYISIDYINKSIDIETISILLKNLGQNPPFKLKYLNLTLMVKYVNDFEIFLKNSQNTFINRFFYYIKNIIIQCKIVTYSCQYLLNPADISPNISHEQEYIQSNSQTSNESGEREPEGMSNQTLSFKIKIPYNQKVEQGLRHKLSIFTKDDNIE